MYWKQPPIIKVYEALGAVADGRIKIVGNSAQVYSSSENKFYDVRYDEAAGAIMVNDNGSYYQDYLGYPAIAYLMCTGAVPYDKAAADLLQGIAWKDINTKFKNNFEKTLEYILADKTPVQQQLLQTEAQKILEKIGELHLKLLGPKKKPPEGY